MARNTNSNDERADIYGWMDELMAPMAPAGTPPAQSMPVEQLRQQRSASRGHPTQDAPSRATSQRSVERKAPTKSVQAGEGNAEDEQRKQPPARRSPPAQQPATEYARGSVEAPLPPPRPAELNAPADVPTPSIPMPPARPQEAVLAAPVDDTPIPPSRPTREDLGDPLPARPAQAEYVQMMNDRARGNETDRGVVDDSFFGDSPAQQRYDTIAAQALSEDQKLQAAGIDPATIPNSQRVRMGMMGIDKWIAEQQKSQMYKTRLQTENRARGATAARM